MTKLTKAGIVSKFNDAIAGLYRTGQTAGIGSDDHRAMISDFMDSLLSYEDDVDYGTGFPEVLTIVSNAATWDLKNKLMGDAKVTLGADATITLSNFALGTTRNLWVNATAKPIVITLAGGTFYQMDRRSPITTITLDGDGALYHKIRFEYGGSTSPAVEIRVTVETIDRDSLYFNIFKAAHGYSIGDVIVHTGGAYAKLSSLSQVPIGIVDYTDGVGENHFRIKTSGLVTGLSGLTADTMYYVQADGTLGTTVTNLPFFYAVSTTSGYIIRVASGNSFWNDRGGYDASTGNFPSTGGSTGGDPQRFNAWLVTTAGTIAGVFHPVGTILMALQNSPSGDYTITGWKII